MKGIWMIALASRAALQRIAAPLARRFSDVLSRDEVASSVDLAIVQAAARFDPELGRFQDWARPFVLRQLKRMIQRELFWRGVHRHAEVVEVSAIESSDVDALKNELRELLGDDYETFVEHFAWGASMRDLQKKRGRSFRAIRESLNRASKLVRDTYGHEPVPPSKPPRKPRHH